MEIKTEEQTVEGMPKIETKRRVTAMDTELSKDPLDESDPGYQKPEPKEESTGPTPNTNKPTKEGGKKKRGPKIFNPPTNKEKKDEDTDKRRDRDNKHEQDNNANKKKTAKRDRADKEQNKEERHGTQDKSKYKDNLRNLINDDEFSNKPRGGLRGNRGRGGRGGRGRGGHNQPPRDFDQGYHPGPDRGYERGPRDDRDRYQQPLPRSNDDFYVRPSQRGHSDRRREHQDMYQMHHAPRYNYGPPQGNPPRGGRYQGEYVPYDYPPMQYGPPRHYNEPIPYRGRGGRIPPHEYERYLRPEYDSRRGAPMRGGPPAMRGGDRDGMPHWRGRGGGPRQEYDTPKEDSHSSEEERRPLRGHRGRGRGDMRGRGQMRERGEFHPTIGRDEADATRGRGDFRGRGERGRGDLRGRGDGARGDFRGRGDGGRGDFRGRGEGGRGRGEMRGRGDFNGRRDEEEQQREPILHRRARGGHSNTEQAQSDDR